MNEIARVAEAALRQHPHPALRLTELHELVSDSDRTLTVARLRAILEGHPERFRILEAWSGRWSSTRCHPAGRVGASDRPSLVRDGPVSGIRTGAASRRRPGAEAWVVATMEPSDPSDGSRESRPRDTPRSATKLRESVRWLARGIDGRSRMELSRWYAIALAEREARAAFLKKAS